MTPAPESIGLIAGSRSLPVHFARAARTLGMKRIVAVGFTGETDPQLAGCVDELIWLRVGQLTKMIEAFTLRGIGRCVMLGQIAPKNLFELRPDWKAMTLLLRLKEKNAHSVFGAIADELQRAGVTLVEATPWLHSMMPDEDFVAGPKPSPAQRADVAYGFSLAKAVSGLEIGQLVVVQDGTVLAVEGFEGTDACLRRGGELSGRKRQAVAVKVAKAGHDMRFDIPCIGPATLHTCAASGIAVLAVEARRTLLLDLDETLALARQKRVTLIGVSERSLTPPLHPTPLPTS